VLGDLGIDQFLAMRLELAERAFLIDAHQPTVSGDVASENRGQPAVNTVLGHKDRPDLPSFRTEFMGRK
jgi:hypothetical protein